MVGGVVVQRDGARAHFRIVSESLTQRNFQLSNLVVKG